MLCSILSGVVCHAMLCGDAMFCCVSCYVTLCGDVRYVILCGYNMLCSL